MPPSFRRSSPPSSPAPPPTLFFSASCVRLLFLGLVDSWGCMVGMAPAPFDELYISRSVVCVTYTDLLRSWMRFWVLLCGMGHGTFSIQEPQTIWNACYDGSTPFSFSEVPQVWSLRPLPKTDFGENK